ncbi:MAG: Rrf2 family transcriptional regulator [Candidatus Omnitrophica bacterium]|nr:Rrf2 family transcriptional regulator [Candidatus Omnitrophota bacterium]
MRFTTKTEYGLVCLVYLAKRPLGQMVTVRDVASDEHYSPAFAEKIFQRLRSAKIVTSHQGKQGGYTLARPPAEITLREIIEALDGETFKVFCEPRTRETIVCTHFSTDMCLVSPVWMRTKEVLDHFFGSISLEMLANGKYGSDRASA